MTEAPRMAIVPAEATEEMLRGRSKVFAQGELSTLIRSSPNAGKLRRADLERARDVAANAQEAGASHWADNPFDPRPMSQVMRDAWQDAFAAALGLEIAEDETHD